MRRKKGPGLGPGVVRINNMKAVLVPLDGGNPIEITKDLLLVGRRPECDLRLDHKTVSKLHCVLVKTEAELWMRDLESTNGCRVNGRRVKQGILNANDTLLIAGLEFRVVLGPDEVESTALPPSAVHRDVTECVGKEPAEEGRDFRRPDGPRPGPPEISLGDLPMS